MNSQERVRSAIEVRRPDRVPIVFWSRDQTEGDLLLCHRGSVEASSVMGLSVRNCRACGEALRRLRTCETICR